MGTKKSRMAGEEVTKTAILDYQVSINLYSSAVYPITYTEDSVEYTKQIERHCPLCKSSSKKDVITVDKGNMSAASETIIKKLEQELDTLLKQKLEAIQKELDSKYMALDINKSYKGVEVCTYIEGISIDGVNLDW